MQIRKLINVFTSGSVTFIACLWIEAAAASSNEDPFKLSYSYPDVECPITMEDLKDVNLAARTSCGHWFTNNDLAEWVVDHDYCPLCRTTIKSSSTKINSKTLTFKYPFKTYLNTGINFVALSMLAQDIKTNDKIQGSFEEKEIKKSKIHCNCIVQ